MSLFENNEENFPNDKKFPQPPFLQRSVSAPAIAEHVSEAIIPAFKFDSEEEMGNMSLFPSRLNPRLPQTKKGGHEEDYSHLFGETNQKSLFLGDALNESSLPAGLISSFIGEAQPRTPLDLIQADFPSTPSSIYSKHLLNADARYEQDMQAAELKVASITEDNTPANSFLNQTKPVPVSSGAGNDPLNSLTASNIPPLISGSVTTGEDALEQAAKSLQKLYVNPDLQNIGNTSQPPTPLLSQYHTPLHANPSSSLQSSNFFQPSSPLPANTAGTNSTGSNSLSLLGNVPQNFGNTSGQGESILPFPLQNPNPASSASATGTAFLGSETRINLPPAGSSTSANLPAYSGILGAAAPVPATSVVSNSNSSAASTVSPPNLTTPHLASHNSHSHHHHHHHNNANHSHQHHAGNTSVPPPPALHNPQSQPPGMPIPQPMQANPQAAAIGIIPQLSMHPGNLATGQGNIQQAQYFVQPMYVAANGQPMFYRPNGQFGQEFMYPNVIDSTGIQLAGNSMIADPNQILQQQAQLGAFIPQFQAVSTPLQAYWPTSSADAAAMQQLYQQNIRVGLPMAPPGVDYTNQNLFNMQQLAALQNQSMGRAGGIAGYAMAPGMISLQPGPMPGMIPRPLVQNNSAQASSDQSQIPSGGQNYHTQQEETRVSNLPLESQTQSKDRRDGSTNAPSNLSSNQNRVSHENRDNNTRTNNGSQNTNNGSNAISNGKTDRNGGGNNKHSGNGGHGNNNSVRDSLVEEFRSTFGKSKQWTLKDLTNHIVAFCQDQHGSRFIQQRLEICSDPEKQLVFDEIYPSAQILMTDVFGNYVLQKLFEYGSKDQCEALAVLLKGQAVQLSMQMYGCRVVQKALEYVSRERLVELVSEFDSPQLLIRCVHDSNGNHVIQKCIEVVSKASKEAESSDVADYLSGRIQFIIDAFHGKVKELSSHPYGCRVVQRILEHCTDPQKGVILEELRSCCSELVQDCYGNYVIQFVMQHGWDADRAVLIKEVQEHLLDFSQHKFASNVVEKCLQYASKKDRDEMIWTIINVTFDLNNPVDAKGHCVLESMVRDPYANYVVQKVIDVSDEKQRGAIMRYVKDNINQLRKYTYGKHIIVRLEKITNEKF